MMCPSSPLKGEHPFPSPHIETLCPFGWNPGLASVFADLAPPGCEPGRVVAATRGLALAQTASGEIWCTPSGRFRERCRTEALGLCAGDWIILQRGPTGSKAVIRELLPRAASLARHEAGQGSRLQVLAANIEVVLLLMGLDRNFNPSRMERLLALAWGSGAQPVVILTKADLEADPQACVARIEGIAPGARVLAVSSVTGDGLGAVRACLQEGCTAAMIGSSGVGKSTLLNALSGQELRKTREVRAVDGRGRHTTSLRELFLLPGGGCLIDTPGIREVGLAAGGADVDEAFSDLSTFAARCRFRDCAHGAEPGCAVQEALASGQLDPHRYEHYLRLRRELAYESARSDERLWREREEKWRHISKTMKHFTKG